MALQTVRLPILVLLFDCDIPNPPATLPDLHTLWVTSNSGESDGFSEVFGVLSSGFSRTSTAHKESLVIHLN